jgi:hypothetical protein
MLWLFIFLAPAIYFATISFGAIGVTFVWLILNIGYVILGMLIMYRRLLTAEKWRWFRKDIGIPVFLSFSSSYLLRILIPQNLNDIQKIGILGIAFLIIIFSTAVGTEWFRARLRLVYSTK